jgi:hypothetical protein
LTEAKVPPATELFSQYNQMGAAGQWFPGKPARPHFVGGNNPRRFSVSTKIAERRILVGFIVTSPGRKISVAQK